MTTITLRTAFPGDRETVVDLIQILNRVEAALTGDRKHERSAASAYYDELMQRLSNRSGRIILAEAEGIAIAAMGFSIDEDAAYVTDDVRRHGTVTDLVVTGGMARQGRRTNAPRRGRAADPARRLQQAHDRRPFRQRGAERHVPDLRLQALRFDPGEEL